MLQIVLLFIDMPIAASLFLLLLLLLLLLSKIAGLVLGFVAVYYSLYVLHTYTRHFLTSWGVYSSFNIRAYLMLNQAVYSNDEKRILFVLSISNN